MLNGGDRCPPTVNSACSASLEEPWEAFPMELVLPALDRGKAKLQLPVRCRWERPFWLSRSRFLHGRDGLLLLVLRCKRTWASVSARPFRTKRKKKKDKFFPRGKLARRLRWSRFVRRLLSLFFSPWFLHDLLSSSARNSARGLYSRRRWVFRQRK